MSKEQYGKLIDEQSDQYNGQYVVPKIPGNTEQDEKTKKMILEMKKTLNKQKA